MSAPPVLAIANRGEIAIRIARTASRLGWRPALLLGDADLDSLAARTVGTVERVDSEFDPAAVIAAARRAGASALHPGYGFLSERPELAAACNDAGILFIGPSQATLSICGDKLATRAAAVLAGVPLLPASRELTAADAHNWQAEAGSVGYPLIVKVAEAGGGRGLRVARSADDLERSIRSALNEAGASGANTTFYFERYLEAARHIEVQVAGDGKNAVALGDRDCSLQRRHQKVIEEAPAPGLSEDLRARIHASAIAIAQEVGLKGLATVEFLLGRDGTLAFIEVNPRLQVEHTVTEEVSGLDLVEVQLQIATGEPLPQPVAPHGHTIQARLYAEDASREFMPSPGTISVLDFPGGLRIDAGFAAGDTVSAGYDPMIAKFISHGSDRTNAIHSLSTALSELRIAGLATNRPWLLSLLSDDRFQDNTHDLTTAADVTMPNDPPPEPDLSLLAGHLSRREHAGQGAWQQVGPFRVVGRATMVFHGSDPDWQTSVHVPEHQIDEPGLVVIGSDSGYELTSPRGRWFVSPGSRQVSASGRAASDGQVRTPMPGTLLSVDVTFGQEVEEGQVVAIMSAMKIEISLAAPFAGVVEAIHAAPGDLVGSRQIIVTIQPAEHADE